MIFQLSCGLRSRRNIAASLAGAGLLSCLYSRVFLFPLAVEAVSVVERFSNLQCSRQYQTGVKVFKHSNQSNAYLCYMHNLTVTSNTNGKAPPHHATSSRSVTTMSTASDVPDWARKALNVTHENFEKTRHAYIPELGLAAVIYKHKQTELSVISLVTDITSGREMCFDIVVPTPPFNDTGCPHILEHAVLEGSQKYPSKEGFALLLQGGFQSFVNAFTYKDRTSYLFASTNEKDFYITADFYMSSVFQPNIRHDAKIFKQEAWHYKVAKHQPAPGHEDDGVVIHDRHISYGGVVYSEMRKAYSDPVSRGQDYIYENLHTNSYKFDSGGNPKNIVELEYPELVKFYETYYGPKTANVYFYGPDDPYKRLTFVDDYLRNNGITTGESTYNATLETAQTQLIPETYKEMDGLVVRSTFGATGSEEEDIIFTGWLLDPQVNDGQHHNVVDGHLKIDSVDALGMEVLEYLLIGTPESLLYSALIKSQLGKKVVGSGLTDYFKQSSFIVGLGGINCKDMKNKDEARVKFQNIVMSTLGGIVENGIKQEAIDAAMNFIEFQIRELNTGTFPKGLMLINLMQSHSQYQRDPIAHLYFDTIIAQLKDRLLKNPQYFQDLVKKHFVDNKHRVTVHMEAMNAQEYEKVSNASIQNSLMQRLKNLSEHDVDHMEAVYKAFKAECEKPEDPKVLEALPMLSLNDINRENELIPTQYYLLGKPEPHQEMPKTQGDDVVLLSHPVESHGVVYLDLAISLEQLGLEDIKYLDLFAAMLKEAGTHERTAEAMSYHIAANLGNLVTSFSFMTPANGRKYGKRNDAMGHLYVRSKALLGKENDMLDIVLDVLKNGNLENKEKGLEIIRRRINQMESSIVSEGHTFASRRLMSRLSVAGHATEVSSGYEYLNTLKQEIQPVAEKNWYDISSKLENIRQKLLHPENLIVNITASPEITKHWLEQDCDLISNKLRHVFKAGKNGSHSANWVSDIIEKNYSTMKNEVIVAPTNVNFVGMGGALFNEDDLSGADSLVMHYIGSSYLWKQVRMSLGAYGVFCNLSPCGDVVFMSYADPHFNQTIEVYKNVHQAIGEAIESLSDREFLRQKIGKISGIDKPLTADAKGFVALNRIIKGETDSDRQMYREDILNATVECFNRLKNKMASNNNWHNVCAVVSRTTANTLPSTITKLDIGHSD